MLRYTLLERGSYQIANSIMKTSMNVKQKPVKVKIVKSEKQSVRKDFKKNSKNN
jgi:hypothetical protein